jgi:hypothetical protein
MGIDSPPLLKGQVITIWAYEKNGWVAVAAVREPDARWASIVLHATHVRAPGTAVDTVSTQPHRPPKALRGQ